MDIIISQLPADEWQKYREIRLLALKSDPYAFGSSYEEEANLTETDWRNRICAMWFAIVGNDVVGLIGLIQQNNLATKHCGHIISLWIKPEFRRQGIAKRLIQKLKDIAPNMGLRKLSLHVSTTQPAAKQLYEMLGFNEVVLLKENLLKDKTYLDEYLMEWSSINKIHNEKSDFEILEQSLWLPETRFDQIYMEKILHPDFFEFGRSGRRYTRRECIEVPPQEIHAKLPLEDFVVHNIKENVRLITYISEVINDGAIQRANRSSLWISLNDSWQLRFHQGTAI